jgi:hypothetical protein
MSNADLLQRNTELCRRCARQMRREILMRLDFGDTNRVGTALERLAGAGFFPSVEHLMTFLGTCDAEGVVWFVMQACATDQYSDSLATATGKNRLEWLALFTNQSSWEGCPPLHAVASRLSIVHS